MKPRGSGLFAWGLVCLCLGLVAFGAWLLIGNFTMPRTTVTIGGTAIKARVVSTEESREQGLSGVDRLGATDGMLFVFDEDGRQGIWMKDMSINIDVIWLSSAKKVVHIEQGLTPSTYPETYASPKQARYVLEVADGTVAKSGIRIGTTAQFYLP